MKSLALLFTILSLPGCGKDGDTGATDDTASAGGSVCEGGVCVLSGVITEDLTLTPDVQWLLRGGVFIGDDESETVLTIEPGTVIYGESATDGMLVIRRGSKIIADGTADAPIVFTSSLAEGERARGNWGGLILNGRAPVNSCGEDYEGELCEAYGEGGTGWYGGTDADDNSGVLRYVRVEFAGTLISPDNELNGIAFQGVGSGTEVDFIQVHMNADDGVEFFGGTVDAKHILVTGVGDDLLDWTDGWQGRVQFAVLHQFDGAGDNGIEADNNGDNNDATPRSAPTLSNITLIGSPDSDASDLGMLLREGTAGELSNVVILGFNEACVNVDHDATWAQADAGALALEHIVIDCATSFVEDDKTYSVADLFASGAGNMAADPQLADPFNEASPGYTPLSGSPAASGASVPSDSFFEQVDYIGGVDPASDWTQGWATYAAD